MTADIRVAGPARSARANKAVEHGIWGAVIDGALVLPDSSSTFGVVEPATGREIARVVAGDAALVDQAVVSARRAYETDWRNRSPRDRAALLRALAEVIRANADELEELETREVGKPRHIAANDVRGCHSSFDYYAALADSLHGELLDHGLIQSHIIYEPYGVVAGVLPFNWPPSHFGKKSAPALIAGNTIVLKPGEQAPLTALRLAEIAAGVLPQGVLNAVPGIDAGPALVSHPLVSRVSFIGASATGRRVLAATAANVT